MQQRFEVVHTLYANGIGASNAGWCLDQACDENEQWFPDPSPLRHLQHEHIREGFLENYDQVDSLSYLFNIHMKYLKYGHANVTDIAYRWIRYGLKTREEMIPVVEEIDGVLDQDVKEKFCEFIRITTREFTAIMDKWYNRKLFEQDMGGA